jgi:hypothetical protein
MLKKVIDNNNHSALKGANFAFDLGVFYFLSGPRFKSQTWNQILCDFPQSYLANFGIGYDLFLPIFSNFLFIQSFDTVGLELLIASLNKEQINYIYFSIKPSRLNVELTYSSGVIILTLER